MFHIIKKVSISFHRFQSRVQEISMYFVCSFYEFYMKFLCSLYVVSMWFIYM